MRLPCYLLPYRIQFRCDGPGPNSIKKFLVYVDQVLKSPTEKDYPVIEPGKSWSATWTPEFPGDIPDGVGTVAAYFLRKSDIYKLRMTVHDRYAPHVEGAKPGTKSLESNELEVKVLEKKPADPPDGGKPVKEKTASDQDKLQGTWVAVSSEVDGKVFAGAMLKGLKLTIEGDRFTLRPELALHFPHGTFSLDAGKQPRAIDFTQKYGLPGEEPTLIPGIYEFDGETLKICRAISGGERPTGFTTKPDSGRELLVFQRPTEDKTAVESARAAAGLPKKPAKEQYRVLVIQGEGKGQERFGFGGKWIYLSQVVTVGTPFDVRGKNDAAAVKGTLQRTKDGELHFKGQISVGYNAGAIDAPVELGRAIQAKIPASVGSKPPIFVRFDRPKPEGVGSAKLIKKASDASEKARGKPVSAGDQVLVVPGPRPAKQTLSQWFQSRLKADNSLTTDTETWVLLHTVQMNDPDRNSIEKIEREDNTFTVTTSRALYLGPLYRNVTYHEIDGINLGDLPAGSYTVRWIIRLSEFTTRDNLKEAGVWKELRQDFKVDPGTKKPEKKTPATDRDKLQGTWAAGAATALGHENELTIKGNRFTWVLDMGISSVVSQGTFTLDPKKQPKAIDFMRNGLPQEKQKPVGIPAIYELDGDTLKVCVSYVGKRPMDFTTKPGAERQWVYVFRRLAAETTGLGKLGEQKAATDMDKLQGAWVVVSSEEDGKAPDTAAKDLQLTVEGNRFQYCRDGSTRHFPEGTFTLDPSKQPKAIDFTQTSGMRQEKPVLVPGIYELDGATLKLCSAVAGGKRPTDFTTKPGSGRELIVLRRPDDGAKKKAQEPDAWSEPVNGLRGRLRIAWVRQGDTIRPEVTAEFKNVQPAKPLAVSNRFLLEVRIHDESGKEVKGEGVMTSATALVPEQWGLVPAGASLSYPADLQCTGSEVPARWFARGKAVVLVLAGTQWTLPPGRYVVSAQLTAREMKKPPPADTTGWKGTLTLPPVEVVVPGAAKPDPPSNAAANPADEETRAIEALKKCTINLTGSLSR